MISEKEYEQIVTNGNLLKDIQNILKCRKDEIEERIKKLIKSPDILNQQIILLEKFLIDENKRETLNICQNFGRHVVAYFWHLENLELKRLKKELNN